MEHDGVYGVVDKPDGAVILPIDGDHIWLVEQFRYTVGERTLELPQGAWASNNVDPETLARGELREETGLTAGRMTELPWMWMAYGFVHQRQHIFVAEELARRSAPARPGRGGHGGSSACPSPRLSRSSRMARFAMFVPLRPGPAIDCGIKRLLLNRLRL